MLLSVGRRVRRIDECVGSWLPTLRENARTKHRCVRLLSVRRRSGTYEKAPRRIGRGPCAAPPGHGD
jgi:hypothetical protein